MRTIFKLHGLLLKRRGKGLFRDMTNLYYINLYYIKGANPTLKVGFGRLN